MQETACFCFCYATLKRRIEEKKMCKGHKCRGGEEARLSGFRSNRNQLVTSKVIVRWKLRGTGKSNWKNLKNLDVSVSFWNDKNMIRLAVSKSGFEIGVKLCPNKKACERHVLLLTPGCFQQIVIHSVEWEMLGRSHWNRNNSTSSLNSCLHFFASFWICFCYMPRSQYL